MKDPRYWRELGLRGGMTLVIAAIAYVLLATGPWVFALPAVVAALVTFKWLVRPSSATRPRDEDEDDEGGISGDA